MSHPCDKGYSLDFEWEWALERACNRMDLSRPTPAKKRKRKREDQLTDRWPTPPRPGTPKNAEDDVDLARAYQEGLSIKGGRKELQFMPERPRPKLTKRRYTSWLPKRSDHVTKHEMQLAKIAELMRRGKTTPQIAKLLNLAPRTARENVLFLLLYRAENPRISGQKREIRRFSEKWRISMREDYVAAD